MPWLRRNWFVLGLAAAVALAWLVPAVGASGGPLRTEVTAKAAVAVIFLAQGLALAGAALQRGFLRWRLHLLVQTWVFLLFPLLGLLLTGLAGGALPRELRLGLLFLCALPTTISTSIVFTTVAGGNTAGAIFNATVANRLGIVLTPVWTRWFVHAGGGALPPLGPVLRDLLLLLFAPFAAGQALRWWLGRWADQRRRPLAVVNSGLVLFIVFAAFANSVQGGVWRRQGAATTLVACAAVGVLFAVVTAGVGLSLRAARLDRGDARAGFFCASQKTLAAGVPMAQLLFGADPGLGLILLPVMLYHPLQLVVQGLLAARWSREPT